MERRSDYKWVQGFFWSEKNVLKLVMMVALLCDYIQNHAIVYFRAWRILWHMNYMATKNKFNKDTCKTDVSISPYVNFTSKKKHILNAR